MARFSAYALLLIVLVTPAVGEDPDQVASPRSENLDLQTQVDQLLEQAQKRFFSSERRELRLEALPLAKELAINHPGADNQRQWCEISLLLRHFRVVAVCEEADRLAEASDVGSTRFLLGKAYVVAKRWQVAETVLLETLDLLDEGEARRNVYFYLGVVYESTRRIDEAMAAYEKSGRPQNLRRITGAEPRIPKDDDQLWRQEFLVPLRAQLEGLFERIQEDRDLTRRRALYAEALPLAKEVARFDPGADSQRQVCEISIGARDVDVVDECEDAMLLARPSDAGWTRFLLAQAYSLAERWQDAETIALEALELLDEAELKPRFYRFLGFIYEKTKRYDEAIAAYEQGDAPTSVQRVKENLETSPYSHEFEEEEIRELKEELDARKSESGGG